MVAVVVALLALGGLYLWPLAGPGPWISGDSPFYLAASHALEANLRAGRGLWGWTGHDLGGFPVVSLFVPAALGLVTVAGAGLLVPLAWAYKALVGVSLLLPAVALALALGSRLGAWPAFLAGAWALGLTYHVVQPLNGAWAPYLAAGFLWLTIGAGERWLREGASAPRGLAVVAAATAAALSDPSAWLALPCVVIALAVAHARQPQRRARLAGWAGLALAPAAVWIAGLGVTTGSWGAPVTSTATVSGVIARLPGWLLLPASGMLVSDELLPALRGWLWGPALAAAGRLALEHVAEAALIALAVVAGRAVLRGRLDERARDWAAGHLVLAGLLLAAMLAPRGPLAGWLVSPERLVPYLNLALLGLAAAVLGRLAPRLGAGALAVLLALVVVHAARVTTFGDYVLLTTGDRSIVHTELSDVWRFLRADAAPGRVLYETVEGVGFLDGQAPAHVTALAAMESGRPSLATWRVTSLAAVRQPALLAGDYPLRSLDGIAAVMRRWECGWVVVWWPGRREALHATGAFDVVHESPQRLFTVLRLRGA